MRNITILNFSGRKAGNCAGVETVIRCTFPNANIRAISVSSVYSPCNSCDYECLKPDVRCPLIDSAQEEAMRQILNSDLVYYIIPNYCGVPCGNYYAFNERNVGYFNGDRELMGKFLSIRKRFIMISNTEGAAFEMVMHQLSKQDAKALYLKSSKYAKSSIAGDLMTSTEAKADLTAFLAEDLE